jgi:hypothetical protein
MATNLNVTELDFADIKQNLKNYLKQQSTFTDYNFDGSGLNVLLDVLAYNTHYNAMAAHLSLNEAFLESAQIRGNAVSRARMLGYVPTSELTAKASVTIVVDVSSESGTIPGNITIPRGTKLSTTVSGLTYQFVTLDSATATRIGNLFTFTAVAIGEGAFNSIKYRIDNDITIQKHQLPHKNVDTTSLRVRVQANEESSSYDLYTKFETLLQVDGTSKVYHLQENSNGFYEVYFGDSIIGKKPSYNNIVTLDYVYSHGKEANGASSFTVTNSIEGFSSIAVTTLSNSAGGADQETLESIRYNAPLAYTSQNRAVTSEDYRAIINRNFTNISSINTWGGEDNAIPDYGKVYICIKPNTAAVLTTAEKNSITGSILKGKNVVSITPTILDPNYSYLELDVVFKYNPNLTDRTGADLVSLIQDTLDDFSLNNLNKFDGLFRHSALTKAIDSSDPAILSSTVRPYLFQNLTPTANVLNNKTLSFPGVIYTPSGASESCITSTSFLDGNDVTNYFNDKAIVDSTDRRIFAYQLVGDDKVTTIDNCGTVTPSTGTVVLNNFTPANATAIRITVTPNSLDIAPKRDEILSIDGTRLSVTAEEDTIATAGSSGAVDYTTTSRFRNS